MHRLDKNLAVAHVELVSEDPSAIEQAQIEASGERYSEANQRMIDR